MKNKGVGLDWIRVDTPLAKAYLLSGKVPDGQERLALSHIKKLLRQVIDELEAMKKTLDVK